MLGIRHNILLLLLLINFISGTYAQWLGNDFQEGGQDQPFAAGGLGGAVSPPAGSGAESWRQADFDNNLLKIN